MLYFHIKWRIHQLIFEASIYDSPLFNRNKIHSINTDIKKSNVVTTLANKTGPITLQ